MEYPSSRHTPTNALCAVWGYTGTKIHTRAGSSGQMHSLTASCQDQAWLQIPSTPNLDFASERSEARRGRLPRVREPIGNNAGLESGSPCCQSGVLLPYAAPVTTGGDTGEAVLCSSAMWQHISSLSSMLPAWHGWRGFPRTDYRM